MARAFSLLSINGSVILKKTEKIEIRVTPEEKDGLMDLARSEGRSVSELIRSIVGAYMQNKTAGAPMSKQRINQMAKSPKTWGTAGLLASAGAFLLLTSPAQADTVLSVNVEISDTDPETNALNTLQMKTSVPTQSSDNAGFLELPTKDSDYEIQLQVQELDNGQAFAAFKICKREAGKCDTVAEPSVQFEPKEGGRIEIGSVVKDPETGKDTPYNLIAIDIAQEDTPKPATRP